MITQRCQAKPERFQRHLTGIFDNSDTQILNVTYIEDANKDLVEDEDDFDHEDYGRVGSIENANGIATGFEFSFDLTDGRKVRSTNNTGRTIEEVVNGRGDVERMIQLIDGSVDEDARIYLVTVNEYNLRGLLTRQSKPFYHSETAGTLLSRFDADPPSRSDGTSPWGNGNDL